MADYAPSVKTLLKEAGCWRDREGKGDHEIWYSPLSERKFPVDNQIKSRHTANGVLKQAGLRKAFSSPSKRRKGLDLACPRPAASSRQATPSRSPSTASSTSPCWPHPGSCARRATCTSSWSPPRSGPRTRSWLTRLVYLLCAATCAAIVYYGLEVTIGHDWRAAMDVRSFNLPRWLLSASLPLSFGLRAKQAPLHRDPSQIDLSSTLLALA